MIHIAIDPGITGAIAAVDDQAQLILCRDLPIISSGKTTWIDANELTSLLMECRNGRPARIMVEKAQSMPRQGVSSVFAYGLAQGSILASCQRLAVALELVSAATWKRRMGLDANKQTSLDKARLLFPTAELARQKDHNRAEALCLAEYSRQLFHVKNSEVA